MLINTSVVDPIRKLYYVGQTIRSFKQRISENKKYKKSTYSNNIIPKDHCSNHDFGISLTTENLLCRSFRN